MNLTRDIDVPTIKNNMALLNFEKIKNDRAYKRLSERGNTLLLAFLNCTDKSGYGEPDTKTLQVLARMSNYNIFKKYRNELINAGILEMSQWKVTIEVNNRKVPVVKTAYLINRDYIFEANTVMSINRAYKKGNKMKSVEDTDSYRDYKSETSIVITDSASKVSPLRNKGNKGKKRVTREENPTTHELPAEVVSPRPNNISSNGEQDPTVEEYERLRQEWYKKEFALSVDDVSLNENVAVSELSHSDTTDDIPF